MRSLRALRSRGLAILAVALLLACTAAPALARMTCVMSGRSVISVGQADGCCPKDDAPGTPTVKATCCELTNAQPPRTAFVPTTAPELPALEAVIVPMAIVPAVITAEASIVPPPFSRPPPDTVRRLAAIGSFLI